jgi:tRNA-Thr(GGU) m(6)t(6)A37 methyltransferase TsaA
VNSYTIVPIGRVHSELQERAEAPKQGSEGAPEAWLEISPEFALGLEGIAVDSEVVVLTWLHEAHREVLRVHPRDDPSRPLSGVFATRSSDRPNPVGLHRVRVLELGCGGWLKVSALEAIDGTPVIDVKPALRQSVDW